MSNLIYAYKRLTDNKIVYIGQTTNINNRHREHVKYEPYNEKRPHYNFPLSKAIRKYGEDNFELVILENNLPKNKLNEREIYWINFYDTFKNGYNQTIGGSDSVTSKISDEIIDKVIELLQNTELSYSEIESITGVSIPHISGINSGNKRKRDNISYPIRKGISKNGKENITNSIKHKISEEDLKNIYNDILYTNMTFKEIANKYDISDSTVTSINHGRLKHYKLDNYTYPLRPKPIKRKRNKYTDEDIEEIYEYILNNPDKTYEEIAKDKKLTLGIVRKIGSGTEGYRLLNKTYPIRGSGFRKKEGLY